ncbi:MAG: DUF4326 domain-containing protein [Aureliella sp.]
MSDHPPTATALAALWQRPPKTTISQLDADTPAEASETRVVNIRTNTYDVLIDRRTKWGNPFVVGRDGNRETVIRRYRRWIADQPHLLRSLPELRGQSLGCHCKPAACHGDVLVELVAMLPAEAVTPVTSEPDRCWHRGEDWQDEPANSRPGWIRTTCCNCGGFVGYRPDN